MCMHVQIQFLHALAHQHQTCQVHLLTKARTRNEPRRVGNGTAKINCILEAVCSSVQSITIDNQCMRTSWNTQCTGIQYTYRFLQ